MTALPADPGSFSSNGGLTRAQPGPGCDVAGPVEVGVQVAVDGADDGVLAGPAASGPAGMAVDRGVGGMHEDDSPSGAFSLGDKDARELGPAGVQDRPVQPGLGRNVAAGILHRTCGRSGHGGHTELFEGDRVVVVDQPAGGLVVEVPPLVSHLAPLLGERPPEPPTVTGAGPGALLAALQVGDPLLCGIEEAQIGHDLPVAGGQEPHHPHVDADRPASGWQQHRFGLGDDDHIPATALSPGLQRLHPTHNRPVLSDLDPPDSLEADMRPSADVGRFPAGSVSGDEQHLVEPLIGLAPRIANLALLGMLALATRVLPTLLSLPNALEIGGEHNIEAAEGLLLGGERVAALPVRVSGADLSELRRLVAVG